MREAYGSYCAGRIYDLLARYPNNFWANPQEFFTGIYFSLKISQPSLVRWGIVECRVRLWFDAIII